MRATRPLALAAALVPALAAAGVRPAYGGTIRVAVPAAPQLRPAPGGPADLLLARAVTAPLLEVDARGALVPGALAEVPAPEAEGRAFRLRLRPGLLDAAGRPIGAAELARHLTALLSGERRAQAWASLPVLGADAFLDGTAPALAGLQVVSPAELLVTLAFPLPEFPWLLATVAAALPDAGPFVAAGGSASAPVRLVKNAHHHHGRPFADELTLHPLDPRGAARQLAQGGVDLVLRPEDGGGRPGPALAPLTVTVAVVNPTRLGASAETVRRTLAALDRADLARRFVRGPAQPLATLVPPAILATSPGAARPPAAAPLPAPPRLSLLADASAADQRALAERLQVKLFDRGVRAAVELVGGERLAARLAAGEYDVALLAVRVQPVRPALAAGQVVFAARGAAAARRAMASLAGLPDAAAADALDRLARELNLVPLVAAGPRASLAAALQGIAPGADGTFDPGALWLLGGGRR